MRCECVEDLRDNPNSEDDYLPEEIKAMRHAPNECPGDHELKRYICRDGVIRTLCSCCHVSGDIEVKAGAE